ncbi:MAG: hybrid sensor histidine kinase/response regulator [Pseudorhodobacter sp.]
MAEQARPFDDPMAEELALLGHDVRSAISDILAGLTSIDDAGLAPADKQQLARAKATGESLKHYLRDGLATLLTQAPIVLETAPTDLGRLLEDLAQRWAYSADRDSSNLLVTTSNLPQNIHCNRTAVDRVLSNLLSNAIRHSQGKPVTLNVSHPSPDRLCFAVIDQGPGFPDMAPHGGGAQGVQPSALPAWENQEGHGLGLNIAHRLARRMAAKLTFENRAGGGGVARFDLPVTVAAPTALPRPDEENGLRGKTILIADDSAPQVVLLARLLTEYGAECSVVREGHAAEAALLAGSYDLALIDLEMPGRTGLEICRAFCAHPSTRNSTTRIVILTAHHLDTIHQSAISAGADQVLVKPITSASGLVSALLGTPTPALAANAAQEPAPQDLPASFARLLEIAGPDMAAELLSRYEEDLASVQTKLVSALPKQDWQVLRAASHVLIALSGTAGMERLEQSARSFNLAANDNDSVNLSQHSTTVLDGLADLLVFVRRAAQERQGSR